MKRFFLIGAMAVAAMVSVSGVAQAAATSTTAQASAKLRIWGVSATSLTVGNYYAFTPTVTAGVKVSYTVRNLPRWATFNTATGEVSGTPDAEDAGIYANITITAVSATEQVPFMYTVKVSGTAANAVALSWTPPAKNTDGTAVTHLSGYRIYYGTDAGSMTQTVDVSNPQARSFELANLPSGHWYVSMVAVSADGTSSTRSAPVQVTI